jgi:hypothetical protein
LFLLLGGAVIFAFVVFFALLVLALINSKIARTNDRLEHLINLQSRPMPPPSKFSAQPSGDPSSTPSLGELLIFGKPTHRCTRRHPQPPTVQPR